MKFISLSLALLYVSSFLMPFQRVKNEKLQNIIQRIFIFLPTLCFGILLFYVPKTEFKHVYTEQIHWLPQLGISLSFSLDALSLLFAFVITGVGAVLFPYAYSYARKDEKRPRLLANLLAFMASMLGLVFADNIIVLFAFWELTSVFSYLLIGHRNDSEDARKSSLQAFFITTFGGLALLAGLLILGQIYGTFSLSEMAKSSLNFKQSSLYLPVLILIFLGAFTKSAQFPFHFWLPRAMAAPTPVSAYLHSATMVKAGVYLLFRLITLLGNTPVWTYTLIIFGGLTMLVGSTAAIRQTDLKLLLAYSTISSLGVMVMLIGVGTPIAIGACTAFILAHALYKGASFMIVGILDDVAGTRSINRLGGLRHRFPSLFFISLLVFGSMAGFLPFFGFAAKEVLWSSLLEHKLKSYLLIASLCTFSVCTMVACCVLLLPFLRRTSEKLKNDLHLPFLMQLGPMVLSFSGLALGFCGPLLSENLVEPILMLSFYPQRFLSDDAALHLWKGFEVPVFLSLASIILGFCIFSNLKKLRSFIEKCAEKIPFSLESLYFKCLKYVDCVAEYQTKIIQNGHLRYYFSSFVLFTAILVAIPLFRSDISVIRQVLIKPLIHEYILTAIVIMSTVIAITSISRLGAIVALGAAGYSIALLYLFFGAPDLAMTQFLVDTLSIIVFVLVFYHLPKFSRFSSRLAKIRDGFIAISFGIVMSMLVLIVSDVPVYPSISNYMAENAVERAHGHNIVNTILVDFRGLDTLGEITVLALAAVGVFGLLKLRCSGKKEDA